MICGSVLKIKSDVRKSRSSNLDRDGFLALVVGMPPVTFLCWLKMTTTDLDN